MLSLFTEGDAAFRALWDAIDGARKRVWLEVYIFEKDAVGQRTLRALTAAARRGCDVILLYDWFGSPDLSGDVTASLRAAGGEVVAFNSLWPWHDHGRPAGTPLHRDHRKIVVIDDDRAFCGGMNVGCDYAGEELGDNLFRDTLLRIDGPAARPLGRLFLEGLAATSDLTRSPPSPAAPDDDRVQVFGLNARRGRKELDRRLAHILDTVSHRLYLTTPYFVPPPWFVDALVRAAQRGVEVHLLTAGRSDIPMARIGGRHLYGTLLRSGIRVHEMKGRVLHAKHLAADGRFSLIGSYNIDGWSSRHNLEVAVAVDDAALARRLEEAFHDDLTHARSISLAAWERRPLYKRPLQWAIYRFAR